MEKYISEPVVDTTKTIPYYKTTILSKIPTETLPFYYVSQDGDRLDIIANTFYGIPEYWWVIAKANKIANGSMAVVGGTRLLIPNI
jgi:hypothetical protein